MAMQGFIDKQPPVVSAAWLNLVDASNNLFDDQGTTNAINIQSGVPGGGLPLSKDMSLHVVMGHTNTSVNVVLTLDSNPQTPVINPDGTFVAVAQLVMGAVVEFKYDGVRFQVISTTDTLFSDGTATNPAIAFSNSPGTGFYRAGLESLGYSTKGISRGTLDGFGSWVMNAPDAGTLTPTLTVNVSGTVGQPAVELKADMAGPGFPLNILNINDNPAANVSWNMACGSASHRADLGALVTNTLATSSFFTHVSGPAGGIGIFEENRAVFGLFMGPELRLMLPKAPGGGLYGYGVTSETYYDMTYDGGSFTGTLTGMGSTITGVFFWRKRGNEVEIFIQGSITGTAAAVTTMTMTGLPTKITPDNTTGVNNQNVVFYGLIDDGIVQMGIASPEITGVVSFHTLKPSGSTLISDAFTPSAQKGLAGGMSFRYKLRMLV